MGYRDKRPIFAAQKVASRSEFSGRNETMKRVACRGVKDWAPCGGLEKPGMKEVVAVIFGLGLLGNALLFVPQAVAVWRKKSDEGVSLITFGGFSVLQAIGIVHGVYQRDASLILGMAASLLSCGTVTLLTMFYRLRRRRTAASGRIAD
jgi:MtN3 and saliva related transmembrane protein